MSGPCDRLARRLPALVDDPDDPAGLDAEERAHVAECLRCQAAVAQHRRIRRTVHGLESGPGGRTPAGVDAVLEALDEQTARRRARRRGVALGLVTVTAVGLGAAAVATRRRSA